MKPFGQCLDLKCTFVSCLLTPTYRWAQCTTVAPSSGDWVNNGRCMSGVQTRHIASDAMVGRRQVTEKDCPQENARVAIIYTVSGDVQRRSLNFPECPSPTPRSFISGIHEYHLPTWRHRSTVWMTHTSVVVDSFYCIYTGTTQWNCYKCSHECLNTPGCIQPGSCKLSRNQSCSGFASGSAGNKMLHNEMQRHRWTVVKEPSNVKTEQSFHVYHTFVWRMILISSASVDCSWLSLLYASIYSIYSIYIRISPLTCKWVYMFDNIYTHLQVVRLKYQPRFDCGVLEGYLVNWECNWIFSCVCINL